VEVLNGLKLGKTLIVIDAENPNLELSARNVPSVKVLRCEGLNVYDVLNCNTLVLLEPSIEGIERRLA
jgi:large subunit ribosomal protein L4